MNLNKDVRAILYLIIHTINIQPPPTPTPHRNEAMETGLSQLRDMAGYIDYEAIQNAGITDIVSSIF